MAIACSSMAELEAAIMKEMRSAMEEVHEQVPDKMKDTIKQEFYASAEPKLYVRTEQLQNTPKTMPLSESGKTITFDAKLDNSGGYSTGKKPSMQDVLELTNDGDTSSSVGYLRPAVGSTGYWQKVEKCIEDNLNSAMSKHF